MYDVRTATYLMLACLAWTILAPGGEARADELHFVNGDRLTGRIVSMTSGSLTFESTLAGKVEVDMEQVATLQSVEPPACAGPPLPPDVTADTLLPADRRPAFSTVNDPTVPRGPPGTVSISQIRFAESCDSNGSISMTTGGSLRCFPQSRARPMRA